MTWLLRTSLFKIIILKIMIGTSFAFNNTIEDPLDSGNKVDLDEYIKKQEILMSKSLPKENAVMLMGPTGSGITTLANYLIGEPLVCRNISNNWIIEKVTNNVSESDIGHSATSKTTTSKVYSPKEKHYSYIDNPGFFNNRGISVQIASQRLMNFIISDVKRLKFLLLIPATDVNNYGVEFINCIKEMANILGMFHNNNSKSVYESIGIVFSKVENEGESDEVIIKTKIKNLLKILQNSHLSIKEKKIFENVLRHNQTEIFSNPKQDGELLKEEQKHKIEDMIKNRLIFIDKELIKFQVRVSENYVPELRFYIDTQLISFEQSITNLLNSSISEYFKNIEKIKLKEFAEKYTKLRSIIDNGKKLSSFEIFIENFENNSILLENDTSPLIMKKKKIETFNDLIPDQYRIKSMFEKQWIRVDLLLMLEKINVKLIKVLLVECNNFNNYANEKINEALTEYFPKRVRLFKQMKNVEKFETELNYLIKIGIENKMNVSEFLKKYNSSNALTSEEYNKIHYKSIELKLIIEKISKKDSYLLEDHNKWIRTKLVSKIKDLTGELKQYYVEKEPVYNKSDGTFTFENHFVNISSIIKKINSRDDINNLKRVQIYSTHSVTFDRNYSISKEKYNGNAPDLVIISPQVIASINITINLSCETVPGYPGGRSQAKNGTKSGENGEDGLPGLPGFNGGNLIIISEKISDLDNLEFISEGIFQFL